MLALVTAVFEQYFYSGLIVGWASLGWFWVRSFCLKCDFKTTHTAMTAYLTIYIFLIVEMYVNDSIPLFYFNMNESVVTFNRSIIQSNNQSVMI